MTGGSPGDLDISRVIAATPAAIYRAHLDPQALASWQPPQGMVGRFDRFEPWEGGVFHITLDYLSADHTVRGKASEHSDVVRGRFVELVPDQRIVETVEFEADDPQFAGIMRLTTILRPVAGGTEVTIQVRDAPAGIKPSDHELGIRSTLANLAAFVE